ncbi:MAG TPA: threonine aldolase, partial [Bacteroidetes bacterium]|nr:threonine aldolase [Bacteroidota bacterium]
CLSKGLGAPVGSLLLGSKETVRMARRVRKALGGGMRQAGFLAAAGIYALDHHRERLRDDHHLAQQIEEILGEMPFVAEVLPVKTNIIIFRLHDQYEPAKFLAQLEAQGILAVPFGGQFIRFVTHLDVSEAILENLCKALKSIL